MSSASSSNAPLRIASTWTTLAPRPSRCARRVTQVVMPARHGGVTMISGAVAGAVAVDVAVHQAPRPAARAPPAPSCAGTCSSPPRSARRSARPRRWPRRPAADTPCRKAVRTRHPGNVGRFRASGAAVSGRRASGGELALDEVGEPPSVANVSALTSSSATAMPKCSSSAASTCTTAIESSSASEPSSSVPASARRPCHRVAGCAPERSAPRQMSRPLQSSGNYRDRPSDRSIHEDILSARLTRTNASWPAA